MSSELGQGDEVDLVFGAGVRIRAIAWRIRKNRNGFVVGMMLSEVTPEYEALVERSERSKALASSPPMSPLRAQPIASAPPCPRAPDPWWRLRVKETDGPRTRIITLAAASRSAALEKAVQELGAGWDVIEAGPRSRAESGN